MRHGSLYAALAIAAMAAPAPEGPPPRRDGPPDPDYQGDAGRVYRPTVYTPKQRDSESRKKLAKAEAKRKRKAEKAAAKEKP